VRAAAKMPLADYLERFGTRQGSAVYRNRKLGGAGASLGKGNVGLSITSNCLYEGVEDGLRDVTWWFDGALPK
jgi:hypothetical protein